MEVCPKYGWFGLPTLSLQLFTCRVVDKCPKYTIIEIHLEKLDHNPVIEARIGIKYLLVPWMK